MNIILNILFLSMLPISELRGAIPYGIAKGFPPAPVFFLAVVSNILVIFIALFFFDYLHKHFMKITLYEKIFAGYLGRLRKKVGHRQGMLPLVMLFMFVAVPFPGTGAYTGSLMTWFFKIERRKAIPVMIFAVVCAGIAVTLASLGILKLFSSLI